jgi:transcriptional regulator with XRE-family HTH domain
MANEEFQRELHEQLIEFGGKVRALREATGLAQEDFARAIGLHRTEIGVLECARREPRLSTLLILAEGLGIGLGELGEGLHAPKTRRVQPPPRKR